MFCLATEVGWILVVNQGLPVVYTIHCTATCCIKSSKCEGPQVQFSTEGLNPITQFLATYIWQSPRRMKLVTSVPPDGHCYWK